MTALRVAYYMDVGLRDAQEDCIFVNGKIFQERMFEKVAVEETDEPRGLFAVCDGMGGHLKGEWVSRFVCEALKDNLGDLQYSEHSIENISEKIQNQIENEMVENSGTTIAGVAMEDGNAKIFNAGDSRVYKITKDALLYLSHDHSLVQRYVDSGYISQEEAFSQPYKNIIEFGFGNVFRSDWAEGTRKIHMKDDILKIDEQYLICTDGVNDVLRDAEIFGILRTEPFRRLQDFVSILKERMKDNFSFVLLSNA